IDPDDAFAMALLGWERILFRGDYSGLDLCSRAVELNPNHRIVLDLAAIANVFAGDLETTIACGSRALELSPGAPDIYHSLSHIALAHFSAGRFDEAVTWAKRSIELEGNFVINHLVLAASHAYLGNVADARMAMNRALGIRPETVSQWSHAPVRFPERLQLWIEGYRMAGMPEE
ncbi:MAG: CDC27 family protein, partial [Bauldia sp.]